MKESIASSLWEEYGPLVKWGAGAVAVGHLAGYDVIPDLPTGWQLYAAGGVALAIVGVLAANHIDALYPDPEVVTLHGVNSYNTEELPVWELSPAKFESLEVANGPLNPLPENDGECYEVFHYDRDRNVAVGTWRKSKPASAITGALTVDDALETVREMRTYFEPEARRGHHLRQQLPGILRELDAARLNNQSRMLETDLSPSFGEETIDDVLEREMPEQLLPDRMQNSTVDDLLADDDLADDELEIGESDFAVEMDGEALEPADGEL